MSEQNQTDTAKLVEKGDIKDNGTTDSGGQDSTLGQGPYAPIAGGVPQALGQESSGLPLGTPAGAPVPAEEGLPSNDA